MKLKTLFINFLVFAAALLMLEAVLRVAQPSRGFFKRNYAKEITSNTKHIKDRESWMKPDPDLGWVADQRNISGFNLDGMPQAAYQINEQGFRSRFNLEDSSTHKKTIMLLGDSFMFGLYLQEHQTIEAGLQSGLSSDYRIYNISSPGWGIDQMYLAYKKYVEVIDPDFVVIMYIDNDILRNLHSRRGNSVKPRFGIENGKLVPDHRPAGLLEKFCWTNQISNRLYRAYMEDYAARLTMKLFEELIRSETNARREPLLIHIASENQILSGKTPILDPQELIESSHVRYIELSDTLKLLDRSALAQMYLPNDTHFSETGAALVTTLILKELSLQPDTPTER